jgi:hypothetical protein
MTTVVIMEGCPHAALLFPLPARIYELWKAERELQQFQLRAFLAHVMAHTGVDHLNGPRPRPPARQGTNRHTAVYDAVHDALFAPEWTQRPLFM